MPAALKSSFKPLTAVVSKYITSQRARAQAQQQAKRSTARLTGAQVDAHVASTLSDAPFCELDAQQNVVLDASFVQVDQEGRTLGLEDPNEPLLVDDPNTALRATSRPRIVPTTAVSDPALLEEVQQVTHGKQTSIPFFPPPSTTSNSIVDVNQYGFVDPRVYSGTSFDLVGDALHEPLNVIISSNSTPSILTRKGFQSYCRALDFDRECLGLHAGGYQKAYVDPRGWRDQEFLYRQVYTPLDHVFGTCIESLVGGNHVRAWQQQGSGAWFLATSREEDASKSHMIVPNGYNVGRNQLVQQALGKANDGRTSFMFTKYKTDVQFVAGLMPPGIEGVNHDIAVDGLTAVLTVTIVSDKAWFVARDVASGNATSMPISEEQTSMVVGVVAPAEQAKADAKRQRRISLANRFSLSRTSRHGEEAQDSKSHQVWQKLKNISSPKHHPVSPTSPTVAATATSDTVVAAHTDGLPLSVDSASTVTEISDPADNTDTRKIQPSGLVAVASPLSA